MAERESFLRRNSGLPRNIERVSAQIRPKALSGAAAEKKTQSERFRGRLIILAPQKLSGKKKLFKAIAVTSSVFRPNNPKGNERKWEQMYAADLGPARYFSAKHAKRANPALRARARE